MTIPSPELPLIIEDIVVCDDDYDGITVFDLSQRDEDIFGEQSTCLLYTSPSPRDMRRSRMPSSA